MLWSLLKKKMRAYVTMRGSVSLCRRHSNQKWETDISKKKKKRETDIKSLTNLAVLRETTAS